MKTIKIENINAGYDKSIFICQANLEINENKLTSIVGPSGCGKSTLLKAIAGFLGNSGKILIENNDVHQLPANARPITLMFQEPRLFPQMTVIENISFPMKAKRFKDLNLQTSPKFIQDLLIDVGLRDNSNSYPHQLSGGQKQRVALARAIACFSSLLLLDEPFSALDEINRTKMYELLLKMRNKYSLTILMVTHSISEAVSYSDQIVVMKEGKIEQSADTNTVLNQPYTIEVAQVMKSGIYCRESFLSYKNIQFHPFESCKNLNFSILKKQKTVYGQKLFFNWEGIENSIELAHDLQNQEQINLYYDSKDLLCF